MKTFFSSLRTGLALKAPLYVLLLALLSWVETLAQVVVQEGFETQCSNQTNPFLEGCFPGWISTHGNPNNSSQPGVSPFSGQRYMRGYVVYRGFYCTSSPVRGAGIALEYPFKAGVTYKITYAFRTSGQVLNRLWLLTNGLPNNGGGSSPGCHPGEVVPPIPIEHQEVHSPGSSSSWVVHTQEFMPEANFGQLWFRAWNTAFPGQAYTSENNASYFLDDFSLEILCDPDSVISAFHFEDENGNPKTSFCYGEDIYLNGTASQNETQYFIDMWRRPIGSTGSFNWVSSLGWTSNAQVGVINLSEAFANIGYYPLPGFEYQVKLAVANPPCVQWKQTLHELTLTCCESALNPDFGLSYGDTPGGGPATLVAHSFNTYSYLNIPVTHQWLVLASNSHNSGPYTLVNNITTTNQGTVAVYNQAQPGIYYTVIHKVITACGEVCFGKQRYGDSAAGEEEGRNGCEFCGPIDCSIFDNDCLYQPEITVSAPPLLPATYLFTWPAVPGTSFYILNIVVNDPTCCQGTPLTLNIPLGPNQTSYSLPASVFGEIRANCFSYRLVYWCGNTYGWTEQECFIINSPSLRAPTSGGVESFEQVLIYPNPASDLVNLRFEEPFSGQVHITDLTGRIRATHDVEAQSLMELSVNDLPSGIYLIILQEGAERKVYKLVKQ